MQLFEALKSKFLPLTSEEFVSILNKQDFAETFDISISIDDSTMALSLKIRLIYLF